MIIRIPGAGSVRILASVARGLKSVTLGILT
jgi:hypothetical protein